MLKLLKASRGFSLLGMIIVLAIIAALTGGIFYFTQTKNRTAEQKELMEDRNLVEINQKAKEDVNNINKDLNKQNQELDSLLNR